ncbi:MAG: hypothetical protein K0R08_637 [Solimicrobium sp.]|nr:hypothetical protein [Solimicrobium sp.]
MLDFSDCIPEASFLFDSSMEEYLREITDKSSELGSARREVNSDRKSEEDEKKCIDLETWFEKQAKTGAKQKFSVWLNFEEWK